MVTFCVLKECLFASETHRLMGRVSNWLTNGLVEEEGLAHVLYLWDCAFEIEGLGQDNFEDLDIVSQWSQNLQRT